MATRAARTEMTTLAPLSDHLRTCLTRTLFAKLSGALESMFGGGEWFCTTHEGPCKNKKTKTVCRLFIMQRQYSSCKGKTRVPRVRARRRQRVRAIKPKAAWTRERESNAIGEAERFRMWIQTNCL